MDVEQMLVELRQERELLEEAILVLERIARGEDAKPRRGRPPKALSANGGTSTEKPRKRELSPEGRARIAEAAKKRWAEARQNKQG